MVHDVQQPFRKRGLGWRAGQRGRTVIWWLALSPFDVAPPNYGRWSSGPPGPGQAPNKDREQPLGWPDPPPRSLITRQISLLSFQPHFPILPGSRPIFPAHPTCLHLRLRSSRASITPSRCTRNIPCVSTFRQTAPISMPTPHHYLDRQ